MDCVKLKECVACGNNDLSLTLDLGIQAPANNLRNSKDDSYNSYPLTVNRCTACNHLQLTHVVNPDILYKNYLYVSGTSATYLRYMKWYANFCLEKLDYSGETVLDIGCNDGSQLDAFKELGFQTYGVDPAENIFPVSSTNHNVTLGYWNTTTADKLHERFDIITSQNAFAHIPDPLSYLKLVKKYLKPNGRMFISTSQAEMIQNGEFDTIYHEHISFYNAESMRRLAERAGLCLIDVVKTPIHGTSYIFVLAHECCDQYNLDNILDVERNEGLQTAATYTNWASGVDKTLQDIQQVIAEHRVQGYTVIGYGAAAKGMTLITAGKLDIDWIIDDNPLKQNKWCPGVDIQIVSSDYLTDYNYKKILFIPLAWNLFLEIKRQIRGRRNNPNDKFMKYFPRMEIQ
jgi:SAM-dependent methyltransferase